MRHTAISAVLLVLLAIAVTAPQSATAEGESSVTVQDFLGFCEDSPLSYPLGMCIGYLKGMATGLGAAGGCEQLASGIALQQMFVNWARANPGKWQETADYGVIRTLYQNFGRCMLGGK